MPSLPATSLVNCEILMKGSIAAEGASVRNVEFVFHFKRTTNVNPVDKGHIAAAFQSSIGAAVLAALNAAYTQSANWVRFLDDALDNYGSTTEAGVGAITGDPLGDFVAVVLQLKTGLRGKSYRGSKHFAPASESDSIGNTINAGAQTNFNAIGTAILAGFTDSDGNIWLPTIFSRHLSQVQTNPTTVVANQITSFVLNKTLGTMRRRKSKTVT